MNIMHKRINELIYDYHITQSALAEIIGINQATLSRNLSGIHSMKAEIISKIADYFNVSTDYLLGRTDKKNLSFQIPENKTYVSKSAYKDTEEYKKLIMLIDQFNKEELSMARGALMALTGKYIDNIYTKNKDIL